MQNNCSPRQLARRTAETYGTPDVYKLCGKLGLSIEFASWHPITYGELDRAAGRIIVNLNAPLPKERVIAHELGHYLLGDVRGRLVEKFCDEFADEVLDL